MSQSTPSYQCSTCESTSEDARNLMVFVDGTSNEPGPKETNVVKLHKLISDVEGPAHRQHAYYLKGIGTQDARNSFLLSRACNPILNLLDMAFACTVKKNVVDAYGWLASNYQKGDRIFLFGFSRGAYQVRALASMIHEVGLVKDPTPALIESAYREYHFFDLNDPRRREARRKFKNESCWLAVRIHFLGVWDTVSSIGRIVHITASSSVTNACHFRHALALDDRRVKFLPEYFLEVNARHGGITRQRQADCDVEEVWFAGCHSDVGGKNRTDRRERPNGETDSIHAGNVPLRWMRQAADAQGLVFKPEEITWHPEDIDLGRKDPPRYLWFLEYFRLRHQVSYSGTGKHEKRRHLSRPRLIIPGQYVHFSVLPGDVYTPRAVLSYDVDIPTVPQTTLGALWPTEFLDEETTTRLLTSLLSDHRKMLKSLGEVLLLLNFRLDNGQTQNLPHPQWSETIREESGFDKLVLTVVFDVTSNFSTSQGLVSDARNTLSTILSSRDHTDFSGVFYILRFLTRHAELRRRFVAHDRVISAFLLAVDQIVTSRNDNLFPLAMDNICHLINDDSQRDGVINRLAAGLPDGNESGETRFSLALKAKKPDHLTAALKMIACLARHERDHCAALRPRIIKLAKNKSPAGAAAVEVLVVLEESLSSDIHFPNVLGYLNHTLPPLDAETGRTSSLDSTVVLPPIFQINGSGELANEDAIIRKLVRTINSRDAHDCAAATLVLLKLCRSPVVRAFCFGNKVLDVFMKLAKRRETSLLAAYALNTCLKLNMWKSDDYDRVAHLVLVMLDKDWFDDAVGRIEGRDIFRELMTSGGLRQRVIQPGIAGLFKKLESGNHHGHRMALICLEIFWSEDQRELKRTVTDSLASLKKKGITDRKRGIKTLSTLAQMKIGEEAIKPYVAEIVNMMLPVDGLPPPRHELFSAAAALQSLCENETLRAEIRDSAEFVAFKSQRSESALYPQTH